MRLLFEIDYKNYKENGTVGKRPSARAIIIKDNKIAMVYSKKYNYYQFPGGGIESNETKEGAYDIFYIENGEIYKGIL